MIKDFFMRCVMHSINAALTTIEFLCNVFFITRIINYYYDGKRGNYEPNEDERKILAKYHGKTSY